MATSGNPFTVRTSFAAVVTLMLATLLSSNAGGQAPTKKAGPAKAPAGSAQPKFKAIWEPVNVPEDIALKSVHFVSAEEGWVAGGKSEVQGGVIYHTKDGGKTWELQAGDPESSDRGFADVQFVDATHGFAVQGNTGTTHKLYTTSDGQNWTLSGTVPEHRYQHVFTSATTGFVADWKRDLMRTTDGGRTWKAVQRCKIKAEIKGLTRDAECYFHRIHFPTADTGYAIGPLPDDGGNMIIRTDDGGDTWKAWVVLPGEDSGEGSLWFLDTENGLLRTKEGKMFRTSDGGKTWDGVAGAPEGKPDIWFADNEVGWMVRYRRMVYTSNGGKSWTSRDIAFPAMVAASSLPARTSGYVVGDHGMVYRYRIVPIDFTVKGMLPAPSLASR